MIDTMHDRIINGMAQSFSRTGVRGLMIAVSSLHRIEALVWSLIVRALLAMFPTERVLQLLDSFPRRQPQEHSVLPPPAHHVRLAGKCLGRALARSQYLRLRGQPHTVVIGVREDLNSFLAHAWLDAYDDPADFVELRRIAR